MSRLISLPNYQISTYECRQVRSYISHNTYVTLSFSKHFISCSISIQYSINKQLKDFLPTYISLIGVKNCEGVIVFKGVTVYYRIDASASIN